MDVERELRKELIAGLGYQFKCFEEVTLRHSVFQNHTVRADVVAIPIDPDFWGHALAFEVKLVGSKNNYAYWSGVVRQAYDYVYAEIVSDHEFLIGRRISAALVYPAPPYRPYISKINPTADAEDDLVISGVFHCALHFRVGRAAHDVNRKGSPLSLFMGPAEFWSPTSGFTSQAKALLENSRPLGSRRIDVATELGGLGASVPLPEYD